MSTSEIIGSWHNSGFYGHLRSKPRNDFIIEYRHLAKPQPPHIFSKRAQLPSSSHVFSKHDNRHSFLNDALYFEEGLGRRRIENDTNRHQPNLLSWKFPGGGGGSEWNTTSASSPLSSYMTDYRGVSVDASRLNQRIAGRVRIGAIAARLPTTAYRYAHSADNPQLDSILRPSKDAVVIVNRIQKPTSHWSRESVASCLSWYVAPSPPPSKIRLPDATGTSEVGSDDAGGQVQVLPQVTTAVEATPHPPPSRLTRILVL